jgi:hypothetical protein
MQRQTDSELGLALETLKALVEGGRRLHEDKAQLYDLVKSIMQRCVVTDGPDYYFRSTASIPVGESQRALMIGRYLTQEALGGRVGDSVRLLAIPEGAHPGSPDEVAEIFERADNPAQFRNGHVVVVNVGSPDGPTLELLSAIVSVIDAATPAQ